MHNSATIGAIPEAFCWTRMGVESGQELDRIVQRKELERQCNGGLFVWGVGNPLGQGIRDLVRLSAKPTVIFSPMRSAAAAIDVNPSAITLWLDYVSVTGQICPLPSASIVTSRSETPTGAVKRSHFALFCQSESALHLRSAGTINFGELRNMTTGKALGFSQVTAIVSRASDYCGVKNAEYDASLCCELAAPYSAKLCNGVQLDPDEIALLSAASEADSASLWRQFAFELKQSARKRTARAMEGLQLSF
jgi:hypothetical protein